jgi:hypothetical protein
VTSIRPFFHVGIDIQSRGIPSFRLGLGVFRIWVCWMHYGKGWSDLEVGGESWLGSVNHCFSFGGHHEPD